MSGEKASDELQLNHTQKTIHCEIQSSSQSTTYAAAVFVNYIVAAHLILQNP